MRKALAAVLFIWLGVPHGAAAQEARARDGTLIEQTPCPKFVPRTYEEYVAAAREIHASEAKAANEEGITMRTPARFLARDDYDRGLAATQRLECKRIVYMSDGLKVAGLLWRPSDQGTKRLPLIVYLRGGNREFGRIPPYQPFHRIAAEGFVMLASQYRGVDGGEGVEEFGGADVNDVMNLVPLAESLGYIDTNNVFLLGASRGGMETFLAIKRGMKVNAAAVVGSLLDLVAEAKRRPALVSRVWSELMPGFATKKDALLRDRSPMYWAEQISVPSLILHGGGDWRASPADALAFAQKLQAAGKTYELVVYANDDHGLSGHAAERDRRIVEWFRKHMR